jgi:hypothetical protein
MRRPRRTTGPGPAASQFRRKGAGVRDWGLGVVRAGARPCFPHEAPQRKRKPARANLLGALLPLLPGLANPPPLTPHPKGVRRLRTSGVSRRSFSTAASSGGTCRTRSDLG